MWRLTRDSIGSVRRNLVHKLIASGQVLGVRNISQDSSNLFRRQLIVESVVSSHSRALVPARAQVDGRRHFFARFGLSRQLEALERDADRNPTDADKQAALLRRLNSVDPEAVVRRVDSRRFGTNESVVKEYIKALVLLGRLDRTRLADLSRISESSGFQFDPSGFNSNQGHASGGFGAGGPLGPTWRSATSSGEPLLVAMAEPSVKTQLWRALRAVATAYIILLGITTVMEERGLTRNSNITHDVAQASESTKTFKDVVGVDEAREELAEIVEFLKNPAKFTRLGGKMTKGVLLMGPPGTGKTLLAKAIAGEAGVPFFYASGSEFEEMYVGVGARRVRDLFESAKKRAPCIIFIDEIDAIGATRNPKDQQYMRMTLNQLLADMDGFKSSEGIVVIAATNFPEVLDKALVRPGRFDRHVVVPNPDVRGRSQILNLHLKTVPKATDVNVDIIARGTPGFSGADLANLVNVAAIKASNDNKQAVSMVDLEFAKDRIMMGAERKSAVVTEESRRLTAYHESGHAIVASFTEGSLPVHKATIVPRGMALGLVLQLPDVDETSFSRRQMEAKMDVCMAGRVAEELIFGPQHVTSGASSDFEQATSIARNMVERWGMSEKVGFVSHKTRSDRQGRDGGGVSEETRAMIDAEVKRLTDQAYANAKKILVREMPRLHALTKELIDKETLTGDEVRKILGLPPTPSSAKSPYAGGGSAGASAPPPPAAKAAAKGAPAAAS